MTPRNHPVKIDHRLIANVDSSHRMALQLKTGTGCLSKQSAISFFFSLMGLMQAKLEPAKHDNGLGPNCIRHADVMMRRHAHSNKLFASYRWQHNYVCTFGQFCELLRKMANQGVFANK